MESQIPLQDTDVEMEDEETRQLKLAERLQALGDVRQREVEDWLMKRSTIEKRWVDDIQQFHGTISAEEESRLIAAKKSRIVVNLTRNKVHAGSARFIDIVMPTDAPNWGIRSTPDPVIPGMEGQPLEVRQSEAAKRAKAMQNVIHDQLVEAQYQACSREVIDDAATIGTGILKYPVIVGEPKYSWPVNPETGERELKTVYRYRPSAEVVSVWDFVADADACSLSECRGVYERRSMTREQLKQLSKRPGYERFQQQFRDLLTEGPQDQTWTKMNDIRAITGTGYVDRSGFYEVWEYHGSLEREDLVAAGLLEDVDDVDIMEEFPVVVVFCQGKVLRVSFSLLDTGEWPYSIFCWEKDRYCIYGMSIPFRMRNPQKAMNAAWRMMLDNASLSTGPQIVCRRDAVRPANGDWTITGRKLWWLEDKNVNVRDVFGLHEITNNQNELMNIFVQARRLADEETNLPLLAQGDQRSEHTKTASGLQLLLAAGDVVLRKGVRNFDDDFTIPNIRRGYHYNMQNSDDESIKGDFKVDARGSSALMETLAVEESINQMLSMVDHPVFGPMTNADELYLRFCRARKLDPEGLLIPKEKRPEPQPSAEQQAAMQDIELRKAELQIMREEKSRRLAIAEAEFNHKIELDIAKLAQEKEFHLIDIAQKTNVSLASLKNQYDLETSRQELEKNKIQTDRDKAALKGELERAKLLGEKDKE